jgi:hypothetical protein
MSLDQPLPRIHSGAVRAYHLGEGRLPPDREYAPNRGRRWTADHDSYLRNTLSVIGCRAAARHLGRSRRAVYARASALGIATSPTGRPREWTDREDELLAEWVQRAARVLGRTPSAVAARAHRLATVLPPR